MRSETGFTLKHKPSTLFLNGLRGFAALIVVHAHETWLYSDWHICHVWGAVGVDLFFVLSAFLLTRNLYQKMLQCCQDQMSPKEWGRMLIIYFFRRFMRIYPLFFLFACALSILAGIDGDPSNDNFFKTFTQGREKYQLWPVLTFQSGHRHKIFWTLPVEMAYYFVIPVYVGIIVLCRSFWWVPNSVAGIVTIYFSVTAERWRNTDIDQHWPTFMTGSVFGIFWVACEQFLKQRGTQGHPVHITHRTKSLMDAGTYLILFLCINQSWYRNLLPLHLRVFPTKQGFQYISLYIGLIMLKELFVPSGIARMFENKILTFWGKVSFSWYLVHWFSWKYYDPESDYSGFDPLVFRFLRGIGLATALYHGVERPISSLTQLVTRKLETQRILPLYNRASATEQTGN